MPASGSLASPGWRSDPNETRDGGAISERAVRAGQFYKFAGTRSFRVDDDAG